MLRPTKHTELDRTVLAVAAAILSCIRSKKVESLPALRALVRDQSFENDILIVPALNLLYAFGLIEYQPKADIFEYRGPR